MKRKPLLAEDFETLLRRLDKVAPVDRLYQEAYDAGDLSLGWQIREDIQNRITGKPSVARNPANDNKGIDLYSDNRIQLAIRNLHIRSDQQDQTALTLSTAEPQAINNDADK